MVTVSNSGKLSTCVLASSFDCFATGCFSFRMSMTNFLVFVVESITSSFGWSKLPPDLPVSQRIIDRTFPSIIIRAKTTAVCSSSDLFFFIGFLGCFCEHRLASCSRISNLLFSQSSSRPPIKALTSRVVFIIWSRCKINRLNTRSRSEHSIWFNRQTSFVKRSTYLRPMFPPGTNYSLPWRFILTVHLFPHSVS